MSDVPILEDRAYLAVAGSEGLAVDDVAFTLGPGLPEGVQAAGIHRVTRIPTQRAFLPRVHKLQFTGRHILAARFEVIFHVPIGVATQAAEGILLGSSCWGVKRALWWTPLTQKSAGTWDLGSLPRMPPVSEYLGSAADLDRDTHVLVPHKRQVESSGDVYVQDKIQEARFHLQVHQGLFPDDCVVTVCHCDGEPLWGEGLSSCFLFLPTPVPRSVDDLSIWKGEV